MSTTSSVGFPPKSSRRDTRRNTRRDTRWSVATSVVTYVPDGPVTKALKRRVKGRRPKPKLGNLGPLLDENLVAGRKRGQFRYHRDELRLLKGVEQNPDIVDDGFTVLREILKRQGHR